MALPNRLRRTVRILAIDGGGIRGVIPSGVLQALEERIRARDPSRRLFQVFDLIAGTSTGGLIALGLTTPADSDRRDSIVDAEGMKRVYIERGADIFPLGSFRRLRAVGQAFWQKYSASYIDAVLNELLGRRRLYETLTNVLITAYDTERRQVHMFKHRPARLRGENDHDFYLRDVARATTAAPTFFEPALVHPVDRPDLRFSLIDGGVSANNPGMCAYLEARKIFPRARRFIVVSLGTGIYERSFAFEEMRKWGFIDWVSPTKGIPLFNVLIDAQNEVATHHLDRLPDVELYRFNVPLADDVAAMDDARPETISRLCEVTSLLVDSEHKRLDRLAAIL